MMSISNSDLLRRPLILVLGGRLLVAATLLSMTPNAGAGSWDSPPAAGAGSWGAPSGGSAWGSPSGSSGGGWGASTPLVSGTAGNLIDDKMVVVDVVMIGTEETKATSAGINIMSGLSIQFGEVGQNGQIRPAYQRLFNNDPMNIGEETLKTFTRALTVPAIAYTLNIANAASDRSEILTRPTLVATAGKMSDFFSGAELNAVAAINSNSTTAVQPISLQKEIGVRLSVLPLFLEDGRMNLQVKAERTFVKSSNADVNFTSKLETSKVNVSANVNMRPGETLIMGGLSEKTTQQSRDGVPFLQDIPGLQYLFSNKKQSVYQNSLLILITPRPAQYVYQSESAREAFEKTLSEDEKPIASLRARYADWFKPYPNWASVFNRLQDNSLYREFRTGDVTLEQWSGGTTLNERLKDIKNFLVY